MIILVMNCKRYEARREWLKKHLDPRILKEFKIYFIEGGNEGENRIDGDVIRLNTDDGYNNLARKLQLGLAELLKDESWDYVLKMDDDVVLSYKNTVMHQKVAMANQIDLYAQFWQFPHMVGAAYIMSRKAAKFISEHTLDPNWKNKNPWIGLDKYIPEGPLRDTTIPDDYYFSEKICANKSLVTGHMYGYVRYKSWPLVKQQTWAVHDLTEESQYQHYTHFLNS